jgi:hypothetical protein
MARVGASMGAHGELAGEGKEGEWEEEAGGRGLGAAWGAARGAMGLLLSLLMRAAAARCFTLNELDVRKERMNERRKRKGRKRKEKKIWKIFQT